MENGYPADFMSKHKEEAIIMMSSLFDSEVDRESYERAVKRDMLRIRVEGKAEGKVEIAKKMLKTKSLSFKDISSFTDLQIGKLRKLSEQL